MPIEKQQQAHQQEDVSSNRKRNEILTNANVIDDGINADSEVSTLEKNKRSKMQVWLKYNGKRQSRVGDEYQVHSLPQPNGNQNRSS